jgi:3D (Asp-Asp-Asp) domain-containing protein
MTAIDVHQGGLFYVWYVSVYGYAPPATVDSNASRYLAWLDGMSKALAAFIPYGQMGPPAPPPLPAPVPTGPGSEQPISYGPVAPLPAPVPTGPGSEQQPTSSPVGGVPPPGSSGAPPIQAGGDAETFEATAYGPPWDRENGTGITSTGIDLRDSPHRYIVAADPSVLPMHTKITVSPNPFGDDTIVFSVEDTGPAIKGYHIDIYVWSSRAAQLQWGVRSVEVARATAPTTTAPTTPVAGYFNPLAHAKVTPERVDQGADYAGTGYLVAIADGVITESVANGSGWEGEGYVEYKITQDGFLNGVYVYYAEGVDTVVKVGELVKGGSRLCNLRVPMPDGIEIGFAAGVGQESYYAYHDGPYHEGDATRPGLAFSNLIKALGGPPAIVEGPIVGNFPEYMPSGEPPGNIVTGGNGGTVVSGGPSNVPASGVAADFTFSADFYSAIVQLQRGADNASHHSHSAQQYANGITYVPMA